jgi:hypothetical protein
VAPWDCKLWNIGTETDVAEKKEILNAMEHPKKGVAEIFNNQMDRDSSTEVEEDFMVYKEATSNVDDDKEAHAELNDDKRKA